MSERMRRLRIAELALSWVGTPFYPHMAKRAVGADCVQLALEIYKEAGCIDESVQLPKYNMDGGDHLESSIVIDWLNNSGWFTRSDCVTVGDLVTFNIGKVDHHVGIVASDKSFVQSVRHYGVIVSDLRDSTWQKRLKTIWSPVRL